MSVARVPIDPPDLTATAPSLRVLPDLEVGRHGRFRRALEVTVAGAALVTLFPLMLLIGVAVALTSEGPVLYRQRRVGVGGRHFEMVKFRTMCVDADRRAAELFAERNDASGPLHKLYDDPRVTTVGRWLRRFSLDELPQLWNVLNGTMALVGPRPATPDEVARFSVRDHGRHVVRPGITGITQVCGRSDLPWEDAISLDLHYVEHRSLRLDIWILIRTLPAVLRGRGAY
jgi:lipopolysaccharide/colanic/teichoic acid biosynthesis glycosyltransferase